MRVFRANRRRMFALQPTTFADFAPFCGGNIGPTVKCPCHSKKRYADCCGPLHKGTRPAATPEELMRSRYSAFALGEVDYLAKTLCKDHPDKTDDAAEG